MQLARVYHHMDTNHDGNLSTEEITAFMELHPRFAMAVRASKFWKEGHKRMKKHPKKAWNPLEFRKVMNHRNLEDAQSRLFNFSKSSTPGFAKIHEDQLPDHHKKKRVIQPKKPRHHYVPETHLKKWKRDMRLEQEAIATKGLAAAQRKRNRKVAFKNAAKYQKEYQQAETSLIRQIGRASCRERV